MLRPHRASPRAGPRDLGEEDPDERGVHQTPEEGLESLEQRGLEALQIPMHHMSHDPVVFVFIEAHLVSGRPLSVADGLLKLDAHKKAGDEIVDPIHTILPTYTSQIKTLDISKYLQSP